MISMLIDHIGAFLFGNFWPMRIIGRIAMPLFVFGLVEGFIHTSSRKKYFLRIAVCAIVTEIVLYFLQRNMGKNWGYNILFNFMLTFGVLWMVEKRKFMILLPIVIGFAEYLRLDYGWAVPVLAIGFYLTLKYCKKKSLSYCFGIMISLLVTNGGLSLISGNCWQLFAAIDFFPLVSYNGKKGHRLPKYATYAFYPLHLLLILVIRLLFY